MRQFIAAISAALIAGAVAMPVDETSTSSAPTPAASMVSGSSPAANSSSSSNTTSAEPATYTVAVGKADHKFEPDVVLAKPGDTVVFQFYPTNHSVIRAEYDYPCVPYELVNQAEGLQGFFSGFKPVDAILEDPPSWSLLINDTEPIFYYCGAIGSCMNYGMVGAINPNASTSLAHQQQAAKDSTFMLTPGQSWPAEGSAPTGVASTGVVSATGSTAASTSTASPSSGGGSALSTGAIAGIAIGGAVFLLLFGMAIWFCGRQSRKNHNAAAHGAPQEIVQTGDLPPNANGGKHISAVSRYSQAAAYQNVPLPPLPPHEQPVSVPLQHVIDSHNMDPYASSHASPNLSYNQPAPAYGPYPVPPVPQMQMYTGQQAPSPIPSPPIAEMPSNPALRSPEPRTSMEKKGGVERYA